MGTFALAKHGRYVHAQQIKRAKRKQRKLHTDLGRVIRDVERKTAKPATHNSQAWLAYSTSPSASIGNSEKIMARCTVCMHLKWNALPKAKAHKRYEFGIKVGIVSTSKESFVIGLRALPGHPYDGHTLKDSLEQVERLTGHLPIEA